MHNHQRHLRQPLQQEKLWINFAGVVAPQGSWPVIWRMLVTSLFVAIASAQPAEAQSAAAAYLVKQEIADGCENRPGTIDPSGAIERDFNGDGLPDLVISHDAIHCSGENTRSINCGMQVCSVTFYLRRGPLLRKVHDMLGGGVTVGNERIPKISMYAHGGRRGSVRWNGHGFDYR